MSWTVREDLAAGAAVLIAAGIAWNDSWASDGPTPPLTAVEAVTFDDIAQMMSRLAGKPFRRIIVDDEEQMTGSGTLE